MFKKLNMLIYARMYERMIGHTDTLLDVFSFFIR